MRNKYLTITCLLPPSAISEVIGKPLPYDDVLSVRDRIWELSPALVRYEETQRTSADLASLGLKTLAAINKFAKVSNVPFKKPIDNFYQTDVISRACVPFTLPPLPFSLTLTV